MPAALDVNREAVRVLCVAVGVREAARKLGLPESTVQSWSQRGGWLKPTVQPPTVLAATSATNPGKALSNMIEAGENPKILSLIEKREYLASIVRTPIGEVNEKSPLAQKVKRSTRTDKHGETTETEEIELPGKIRA